MAQTIVLLTEGKHESVDYATVVLFNDRVAAIRFCKQMNTGKEKYWKNAEVVEDRVRVALGQPDWEE